MKSNALIVILALSSYPYLACKNANEPNEELEQLFTRITATDGDGNLRGSFDPGDWAHRDVFFENTIRFTPFPRASQAAARNIAPSIVYFLVDELDGSVSKKLRFENLSSTSKTVTLSGLDTPYRSTATDLTLAASSLDSLEVQFDLADTNSTIIDTLNVFDEQSATTPLVLFGLHNDPARIPFPVVVANRFTFGPAFPNPASTSTELRFTLPKDNEFVSITVLGQDGEIVRSLAAGLHSDGLFSLNWDLRDDNNTKVDPGIYRVVFESDSFMSHGDVEVR
jgi:hypothetical protein